MDTYLVAEGAVPVPLPVAAQFRLLALLDGAEGLNQLRHVASGLSATGQR